jgi:hypothetical protein
MIPLGNLLFKFNLLVIEPHARALEQQIKRLLRALTWTDKHLHNARWVDQFSRPDEMRGCAFYLLHAIGGELEFRGSGVAAILSPLGFAW